MILFTFEDNDGKTYLGAGLSRENINRLTDGRPIRIDLPKQGVPKIDGKIMIFFGETERELQQQIAEFIGPETKVNIDPRLKDKMQ